MALSRLRHPVISRYAPSLLKVRFVSSSSGSLARCLCPQTLLVRCDDSSARPALFSSVTGVHDASLKLKLRIGVRNFSTSEAPAHEVLEMPALSPTMTQGNITKWKKKEGDAIAPGDVLCEIETDKATIEFESLEEGFLAKILVPDGSKDVPVGQPICITVEDADDIQNVPAPIGNKPEAKEEKSTDKAVNSSNETQGTSSIKIDASALPPHIVVDMPALSPTMNQGNIARWIKKEGDKINVGDVICEIETDKATLEFECLEEGYLAKILAPEGTKDVAVGQPIAITVEDQNDIEAVKTSVGSDHGKEVKEHQTIPESKHEFTEQTSNFTKISPSAKLLIAEHGLDISSLNASGPYGTLLKSDVVAAIKSGKGAPKKTSAKKPSPGLAQPSTSGSPMSLQQGDSFEDTPNSQIRKIIAKRLLESKQTIPHLYLSTDVILDSLLSFRKELKDKHDIKVSVNDIVIKAVAVALRNVPEANAYWNSEKGEIILCDSVDISIAVATEKGLMTPIVKNADQKSITSISTEVKQLAEKARAGKLAPHEFQGGTFSISNLGMYPVDQFSAIINPPQSGILAVGRGNKVVEPVIGTDGIERAAAVNKMILTLSADHRVFDGKVGGDFLAAVRSNFSDIKRLLL